MIRLAAMVAIIILAATKINAQTPTWQWATQAGGTGSSTYGEAVDIDAQANVYVTGNFTGTANFGSTPITSYGSNDIFTAKYDALGNFQWVRYAGGTGIDNGKAISIDGSGNCYVAGYFRDTIKFDSGNVIVGSGGYDIFLAKYDASGNLLWVRTGGGSSEDAGSGVALDASGNVYITGKFNGSATFGGLPSLVSAGSSDVFVVKYNSSGTEQWATRAGGSTNYYGRGDAGNSIDVDNYGNVFIAGYIAGTANFGTHQITAAGGNDFFMAKYNQSISAWDWAVRGGSNNDDYNIYFEESAKGVGVDANGDAYCSAYFLGTASFEGTSTTITSVGTNNFCVVKYSSSGAFQWVQQSGGSSYFKKWGSKVDGNGNVYLIATFSGEATVGNTTVTSTGYDNVYIAKWNSSGTFQWVKHSGGGYYHVGTGVSVDDNNNIVLTGDFNGSAIFGSTTLYRSGGNDVHVSKIQLLYSLAANATNGIIIKNPDQSGYTLGTQVQLTATPNTGYHFINWSGDTSGTTNPLTITIDGNKNVTANFEINSYTLTVTQGANGTITPGTTTVNHGANQTFTITPNTDYSVDSVIVDGVKVDSTTRFTFTNVTANHTIAASFAPTIWNICTYFDPAKGSVSPPGANVVNGGSKTFTITPAAGYHIDKVYVGSTCPATTLVPGVINSYTFTNVTTHQGITVDFAPDVSGPGFWWLPPTANYWHSQAWDVTDDGIVVGTQYYFSIYSSSQSHAVYWDAAHNPYDLQASGGKYGLARRVYTGSGGPYIMGGFSPSNANQHAFIVDLSTFPNNMGLKDAGLLPGGTWSYATAAINSQSSNHILLYGNAKTGSYTKGFSTTYYPSTGTFGPLTAASNFYNSGYEDVAQGWKCFMITGGVQSSEMHAYDWRTGLCSPQDFGTNGFQSYKYDFYVGTTKRNSDDYTQSLPPLLLNHAGWFNYDNERNYSLGTIPNPNNPNNSTINPSVAYSDYGSRYGHNEKLVVGSSNPFGPTATIWSFDGTPYGACGGGPTNVTKSKLKDAITNPTDDNYSKLFPFNTPSLSSAVGQNSKLAVARRMSKNGQYIVGWGWNAQVNRTQAFLLKRW